MHVGVYKQGQREQQAELKGGGRAGECDRGEQSENKELRQRKTP